MAWNTSHTRRKSSQLFDIDCRTTGAVKLSAEAGLEYTTNWTYTSDEAIEPGECIAMARVPKGFTVTGLQLYSGTVNADATVGVGDPFCCGRFLGPIQLNVPSGNYPATPSGAMFNCGTAFLLSKIGRQGDGCGFLYTYTCETDIILTNGYGNGGFQQGGGSVGGAAMGGGTSASLASGSVFGLRVTGYINPLFTNQA
jgi:hypothetical protein